MLTRLPVPVEISDARVHVRPCAAPPPCLLRGRCTLSIRPFLTALWPSLLSLVHVCAQVLLSSHGSAQVTVMKLLSFSPLQTVPPATVDGGLPATSLVVRGAAAARCAPHFSLSALRSVVIVYKLTLHSAHVIRQKGFRRAAWFETSCGIHCFEGFSSLSRHLSQWPFSYQTHLFRKMSFGSICECPGCLSVLGACVPADSEELPSVRTRPCFQPIQ